MLPPMLAALGEGPVDMPSHLWQTVGHGKYTPTAVAASQLDPGP